jgi:hypothetical protein
MFSTFVWEKGPGILSPGKVWSDEGSGDQRAGGSRADSGGGLWQAVVHTVHGFGVHGCWQRDRHEAGTRNEVAACVGLGRWRIRECGLAGWSIGAGTGAHGEMSKWVTGFRAEF